MKTHSQSDTEFPFIPYRPIGYSDDEMQCWARDFYELMDTRRSVRFFSDKPIPDGVLEHIIATAGTAPSGATNERNSDFTLACGLSGSGL